MRQRVALLGASLAALMLAFVLLTPPAAVLADVVWGPIPGDFAPAEHKSFFGGFYAIAGIAVVLAVLWLIHIARRNRSGSTDRPTNGGEQ
jgi:hypothetical protein